MRRVRRHTMHSLHKRGLTCGAKLHSRIHTVVMRGTRAVQRPRRSTPPATLTQMQRNRIARHPLEMVHNPLQAMARQLKLTKHLALIISANPDGKRYRREHALHHSTVCVKQGKLTTRCDEAAMPYSRRSITLNNERSQRRRVTQIPNIHATTGRVNGHGGRDSLITLTCAHA